MQSVKKIKPLSAMLIMTFIFACTGQANNGRWVGAKIGDFDSVRDRTTNLVWAFPSSICQLSGAGKCPSSWVDGITALAFSPRQPPWIRTVPSTVLAGGLDYCGSYDGTGGGSWTLPTIEQVRTALDNGLAEVIEDIGGLSTMTIATTSISPGSSVGEMTAIRIPDGASAVLPSDESGVAYVLCVSKR